MVEVGKMIALSLTANGSKGGGYASNVLGVGVSGTPQMDGEGAHPEIIKMMARKTIRMRCIRCMELYPPCLRFDELACD